MGKKINRTGQTGKKHEKELQPLSRTAIINLHKRLHGSTFKKKAPNAIKEIKNYARQTMFTKDVRIDPTLNQELWKKGVRNVVGRVEVLLERKKNEDDEENKDQLYTLVKLAK